MAVRNKLIDGLVPATRMGKLMLAGILVWFVNWVFSKDGTLLGSSWLKALADFLSFLALIPLAWFAYRGTRWIVANLLWRLRRRLIVTYLLIGVLPLLLMSALVVFVGYAVVAQGSSSQVARLLDGHIEQSKAAAIGLRSELSSMRLTDYGTPALAQKLKEHVNSLTPVFPNLSVSVERTSAREYIALPESPSGPDPLPDWLRSATEFHGLVVGAPGSATREVRAFHLLRDGDVGFVLRMSYPIGNDLSEHLSRVTRLTVRPGKAVMSLVRTPTGEPVIDNESITTGRAGASGAITVSGLLILVPMTEWSTGKQIESDALTVDPSFLAPGQIWRSIQQFGSHSLIGGIIVTLIASLALIFLMIALVAIISAFFLTRSITGTVHDLYRGTLRVEGGDLAHEIPIRGTDQLSGLARSFNQMTRSIRELLRVSAEKQRLDQEMRIATEVQSRLFPRTTPVSKLLDIAPGVCIPARSVSGDYYDYVEIAPGVLGIVVADVCGKGVSAALMMANLHANLRSQILAFHDAQEERLLARAPGDPGERPRPLEAATTGKRIGRILERVNRQVTGSMLEANYITLFYAEFDERSSRLNYVNAGHNPPLLVRQGISVEKLELGGTVLGLFREVEYEVGETEMKAGDMIVAYTDGLVEARNATGEELGEERLIKLVRYCARLTASETESSLLASVKEWTGGAEQEDDLTLVVIKRL